MIFKPLSAGRKPGASWSMDIGYGLMGLPLAMLGVPFYFYMPNYWFENWGVSLTAIGLALFVTRLTDMLTDPLVGFYSDRWVRHLGYLRQIQLGSLLLVVGCGSLFFPFEPAFQQHTFGYLVLWSFMTFLGWTLISVPYQALVSKLTHQTDLKTRLTSFREGFGLIGVMLALSLPVILSQSPTSLEVFQTLFVLLLFGLALALLLQAWWFKEVLNGPEGDFNHPVSIQTLWRQHRWSFGIMPAYFLNNLANAFPATLFMFFVTYALQMEAQAGVLLAVFFVSGVLGLPFWFWLSTKVEKYQAWAFSMLFSAISFTGLIWVGAGDFNGYLLVCILTGLSLGADLALPSSLQVDLVHRLERKSVRAAGTMFGLWGLLTKLAVALSLGIALPLLEALQLKQGAPAAMNALWWMYGLVPVVLKLVAVVWVFRQGRQWGADFEAG
ncbi:MFS transporter [Thiomicrospira sp. XS5]|uniref:MFS transporter n=1 Tax=Thiomicrospira sp. XS5 TaxID=1775636 RepID=UPI0009EC77B8|nr:MFS transporter [Thiomicrospira sp. XS5]